MTVQELAGPQCTDVIVCPQVRDDKEIRDQSMATDGPSDPQTEGERDMLTIECSLLALEAIEEAGERRVIKGINFPPSMEVQIMHVVRCPQHPLPHQTVPRMDSELEQPWRIHHLPGERLSHSSHWTPWRGSTWRTLPGGRVSNSNITIPRPRSSLRCPFPALPPTAASADCSNSSSSVRLPLLPPLTQPTWTITRHLMPYIRERQPMPVVERSCQCPPLRSPGHPAPIGTQCR